MLRLAEHNSRLMSFPLALLAFSVLPSWAEAQCEFDKFAASDATSGDVLGVSVSLSSDTALVGAYGDELYLGAAYVYSVSGACAAVVPYGCGVNPAGSLTVISGVPSIGTTVTLGVDNQLGTQVPGSLPLLALALAPDPAFPCGTPIPGFGMGGVGAPASIPLPAPTDATLLGVSLYAQGLLVETSAGAGFGPLE